MGIAKLSDEDVVISDKKIEYKKILAIFYFIYNSLEKGEYFEAYKIFIQSYSIKNYDFDTAMVIYCRYIIYCNIDSLYNDYNNNKNIWNDVEKVDINFILKFGYEPNKIVFSCIPFIFNVNLEIISMDGELKSDNNNINILYTKFTDYNINDLPIISIGYFLSSYYKIYSVNYFNNTLKDFKHKILNKNEINNKIKFDYVLDYNNPSYCEKCNNDSPLIYLINCKLCYCSNCFLNSIHTILKNRMTDFSKEKYNNLEYYVRDINIKDIIITDRSIISLTGSNIATHLSYYTGTLCVLCKKNVDDNNILLMKCGCQFCEECLMNNLQAATNGYIYQNKFEKKYGEKYSCLCKKVFNVDDAFNLLKLNKESYVDDAKNRLNQYVNMFCMKCGSQVIEAQEDMMVNSNANNSFFRVKIKKPKGFKDKSNNSISYRNSENIYNNNIENNNISNSLNNNNSRINTDENNEEQIDENVTYIDHVLCANCVENEIKKDEEANIKPGNKIFLCKICDIEHTIEKNEWKKIFKKGCCSAGFVIF